LEVVIDFICKGKPTAELLWMELMMRAAVLFMIFIPCRAVGMWRMNAQHEKWASDGESVEIPVREKTDHGRGSSTLVICSSMVSNLCPLTCYKLLKEGARRRGVHSSLWCTEAGALYKQASVISRFLKKFLRLAGIPNEFAGHSIRHSLITWFFNHGWSEVQVNAYTGHSNNSHTALDHYFHLDEKWLGTELAKGTFCEVPEPAAKVIRDDNVALQAELQRAEDLEDGMRRLVGVRVRKGGAGAGRESIVQTDYG
jgi:hypothetical protein